MNHSCVPNAHAFKRDEDTDGSGGRAGVGSFHAAAPIKQGIVAGTCIQLRLLPPKTARSALATCPPLHTNRPLLAPAPQP